MINFLQMKYHRVDKFAVKVPLQSERGQFIVKTISDPEELIQAFRLRYEVFHHEMIGKKKRTGLDIDAFDAICDHLVIKDKKTNTIVGTYRLNCSLFSKSFYSSQEFNLRRILEQKGPHIELGRACIKKEFRTGIVISLLWRGIAEYMTKVNAQLLFGCASIKTQSPRQAALLYCYFETNGYFNPKHFAPPTSDFRMPDFDLWVTHYKKSLSADDTTEAEGLIPALCRSYLKAGAMLGGEPAYDRDFHCIDFLTILPRENLNKSLWRKYGPCETPQTEDKREIASAPSLALSY